LREFPPPPADGGMLIDCQNIYYYFLSWCHDVYYYFFVYLFINIFIHIQFLSLCIFLLMPILGVFKPLFSSRFLKIRL
jgi:hypothetical protein